MSGGTKRFVDGKIAQRNVLLFAKKGSPECKIVRDLLDEYGMKPADYEVCEIEKRQDCPQIENYLLVICCNYSDMYGFELRSRREVPQLFVDHVYFGGYNEIMWAHKSGELRTLFEDHHYIDYDPDTERYYYPETIFF